MGRLSFIFLFVLGCTSLEAQPNYIDYHTRLIKAQEQLLVGKYKEALDGYTQTLNAYPINFPHDCAVAAQIAATLNDTAAMRHWLVKGVLYGLSREAIVRLPVCMKKIKNYPLLAQKMEKQLVENEKKYLSNIDKKANGFADSLLARDVKVRWEIWEKEELQKVNGSNFTPADHPYTRVLDGNMKALVGYIKKHGYPGQNKYMYYSDQVCDGILASYHFTIFYHQEYGFQFLQDTLLEAVKDGRLRPSEYALLHDWSYNWIWNYHGRYIPSQNMFDFQFKTPFKHAMRKYNAMPMQYVLECRDTVLVNQDRAAIGLCSLEHLRKLREFQKHWGFVLLFGLFYNP